MSAHVEIITSDENPFMLMPETVLIDGVDVGWVQDQSIKIGVEHGGAVTVTLTLLPSRLTVRGRDGSDITGSVGEALASI